MRKIIASLAAGGLLVGAAFTASVISGNGFATAQETDDTTTDSTLIDPGAVWDEFLQDLVDDGIITSDQVAPLRDALVDRFGEYGFRHGHRRGFDGPGAAVRDFLDDGVIDADELATLPEGHPLTDEDGPFAEALADGQITEDEFDAVRAAKEAERDLIRGFLEDGVIDADELAQLPEDHPLVTSDAAADGEITEDELPRRGFRGHHGHRGFGPGSGSGLDDTAEAEETSI